MLVGVGLFGLFTASLASFLIDRDEAEEPPDPAHREIIERLDRIERQLGRETDHREIGGS